MRRYAEADSLILRAIALREEASGSTHGHIPAYLAKRARLFVAQGRYAAAESLLIRARGIVESQWPDAHDNTQGVLLVGAR